MSRQWGVGCLIALYPVSWRARYGAEFAELLEQSPLTPATVVDVVRGAIEARVAYLLAQTTTRFAYERRRWVVLILLLGLLYLPALPLRLPRMREQISPSLVPQFLYP